jgi:hypothetical protein
MSDWTDLQLAHSLAPIQAPEALWSRINSPAPVPQSRWREAFRMAAPCAAAAAFVLLLVRTSALELRPPHPDFVANEPIAVERWLAHEAGPAHRPAPAMEAAAAACKTCHTL